MKDSSRIFNSNLAATLIHSVLHNRIAITWGAVEKRAFLLGARLWDDSSARVTQIASGSTSASYSVALTHVCVGMVCEARTMCNARNAPRDSRAFSGTTLNPRVYQRDVDDVTLRIVNHAAGDRRMRRIFRLNAIFTHLVWQRNVT